MLAMFNETIEKIATFLFSQQIFILINRLGSGQPEAENLWILFANFTIALGIFFVAYKKENSQFLPLI